MTKGLAKQDNKAGSLKIMVSIPTTLNVSMFFLAASTT